MKPDLLERPHGLTHDILLTTNDVLRLTGLKSRVSLWRKSRDMEDPFPRPYKLGTSTTRWKLSEIERWMDQLETA